MTRTRCHRAVALLACALLGACALRPPASWSEHSPERAMALAQAQLVPADETIESHDFSWEYTTPGTGRRALPARLYLPRMGGPGSTNKPSPLVVFSHGLGGSRNGYTYLGKYWASHGYASLHVQHVGSDRAVWSSNALELVGRLQQAAQPSEALARVSDVRHALDRILALPSLSHRIDPTKIAVAGHSYGANTSLLIAGARPDLANNAYPAIPGSLRDRRVKAALILSAPPFYGTEDIRPILQPITIPTLHITATADEITIPGYHSGFSDRLRVFEATGGANKSLIVFRDGSHSMFTDRLNTGGIDHNPQVKRATQALSLAFLDTTLRDLPSRLPFMHDQYRPLLAQTR